MSSPFGLVTRSSNPVLNAQDDSQLRSTIHLRTSDLRCVNLIERPEVDGLGRRLMLLRRLNQNSWRGYVWQVWRLPNQQEEKINDIKLSKLIYAKVAIGTVSVITILICIDAVAEDQLPPSTKTSTMAKPVHEIQTLLLLANPTKDLLDSLQTANITRKPLDLRFLTNLPLALLDDF